MRKRQEELLVIRYLKEKLKYERLGKYITHFIRNDPSALKNNFHSITYRVKDEKRFIEKIEKENKDLSDGNSHITVKNFHNRIGDLLGMKLICLRLNDIKIIEAYFQYLVEEKIFEFVDKPEHKRSFLLPLNPGGEVDEGHTQVYSGYSSIHYQFKPGVGLAAPEEFKELQFEFQLKTILEEAWGEIDHKYRYTYSRTGAELPDYIDAGFYNLSAYLQVAAMQAEYLCRQMEAHAQTAGGIAEKAIDKSIFNHKKADNNVISHLSKAQLGLEKIFGFQPTERTLIYIIKRLQKYGYRGQYQSSIKKIMKKKCLQEFKAVFVKILDCEPFEDITKRNVDIINAINFALVGGTQGTRVALEGLRLVLKCRKEQLKY